MQNICRAEIPCYTSSGLKTQQYCPFQDEHLLYVQPRIRHPVTCYKPYKNSNVEMQSATTYGLSYTALSCPLKSRHSWNSEQKFARNTGKFDFDTVYKLSYETPKVKPVKPFIPKSCLSVRGNHDMRTIHMMSYNTHPEHTRVVSFKPFQGKVQNPVAMDCRTIMGESYQDFGVPVIFKRPPAWFWQTRFQTDYQTVNRLSYTRVEPPFKKLGRRQQNRPVVSAQMKSDTTYGTSYQIPGHFTNKTN